MKSINVEHLGKCYRLGKPLPAAAGAGLLRLLGRRGRSGDASGKKKTRRELWALKDVSFDVEPGTILGVIGPNGAGKTTLLKVIGRVTVPTEGRVTGRGRVVPLLEAGSGFQPDLLGRENIYLNAAMYGIPRAQVAKKLDEIVAFAGIGDFLDAPLKHYSSGMYLRLAFSVAVNLEPDILLADEVLAVGDIEFQERCLERVEEAGKAGMTVLFVSHDMAAITRLCHRVIWLNAGQVVDQGPAEEVVARYQKAAWKLLGDRPGKGRKGSHANEYGEIISVQLTSGEGRQIGAARVSEDVHLNVTFQVRQGGVDVRCAFDVFTRGVHAFRSVQPQFLQVTEPGIYSVSACIPGNLLSEVLYTVNASVNVIKDGKENPLVEYNALSFQVYDTDESLSARGSFKGHLNGVVTPRLAWSVDRERDAVRA